MGDLVHYAADTVREMHIIDEKFHNAVDFFGQIVFKIPNRDVKNVHIVF